MFASFRSALHAAIGALALVASEAAAIGVADLIGQQAHNLSGQTVGYVDELIVDINAGRMLYVIVNRDQGYATLPMRAIEEITARERLQFDMSLANTAARPGRGADPHLRRAGKLIGQTVELPQAGRLGVIHDLEFEPATGLVTRVVVATPEGRLGYPASVLVRGRFSPATRWQPEQ
ncbi:MAG: PRC-barrel domain-containing protein [Betaproteobacteria bacterium]